MDSRTWKELPFILPLNGTPYGGKKAINPRPSLWRWLRLWAMAVAGASAMLMSVELAAMTIGVQRPATGQFLLDGMGNKAIGITVPYGLVGATPLAGDINGDGVSDLVLYHNGVWLVDENMDGIADATFTFGRSAGDIPLLADMYGTGKMVPIIFRSGTWLAGDPDTGQITQALHFGTAGDIPIIADFNGDGVADLAVFREGTWLIDTNRDGKADITVAFGAKGDVPLAFDYDGDGKADLVIFRDGIWYVATNLANPVVTAKFRYGASGDLPLAVNTGLYGYRDAARLLAHATFGSTRTEIMRVAGIGADAWLNEQFSQPRTSFKDYVYPLLLAGGREDDLNSSAIWKQFFEGRDQLRLRMTYALSQILVISTENTQASWYACGAPSYLDTLASNAFGNFRDLLTAVTLHPVMGDYLNLLGSAKADPASGQIPNENYARELLQLFSVGTVMLNQDGTPMKNRNGATIPVYDQTVVQSLARALSGWTIANQDQSHPWAWLYPVLWNSDPTVMLNMDCAAWSTPMQPWMTAYNATDQTHTIPGPAHDQNAKSLLSYPHAVNSMLPANQTPAQDLTAAINNIFNHPNVGPFIGKQLIQRLVVSNPSPAYVARVAAAFNNNGKGVRGDMTAVLRAILRDPEAVSLASNQQPKWGKLREPVVRFVQAQRAFNARPNNAQDFYSIHDLTNSIYLNQDVLRAPSVFNFYSPTYAPSASFGADGSVAPEFQIVTTDSVSYYTDFSKWAILSGWRSSEANATSSPWIKPDYSYYTGIADQPARLVHELDLIMAEGMLSPVFKDALIATIGNIPINAPTDRQERFYTAMWLIMNTPDGVIER